MASSIITVVDSARKVLLIGWKCYHGIENSPKELKEVLLELMSLRGILDTLQSHLSASNDHRSKGFLALEVLNQPGGVLPACTVVLQDVLQIIEGLQKKKLRSIIAAATSSPKFLEAKSRIERLKGLLILALSSDHMYALDNSFNPLYIEPSVFSLHEADSHRPANYYSNLGHYPMPSKSISTFLSVNCNRGRKKSTASS